jgi:hypothetical protein
MTNFLDWYFGCCENFFFINKLHPPVQISIQEVVNVTENLNNTIASSTNNNLVSLETNSSECIITILSKINYLFVNVYLLTTNINYKVIIKNNVCGMCYYNIYFNGCIYVNQMYENTNVYYSGKLGPFLTISYTN